VYETTGLATIKVIREGDVTGQATVGFATIDQTASGGIDYDSVNGEVVFAEGSSEQTIVVPILDDNIAEGDETFALRLFDPEGARLGSLDEITIKIPGDEAGTLVFATWNDETDWVNDSGSDKMVWEGDQMTDPDNLLDIDWNKRDYVFAVAENESALPYDADTSNSFRLMTTAPWYWGTQDKISSDLLPKVQDQMHRVGGTHLGALVTIARVRGATGRLAVDYAITDGTAMAGEHYRPSNGRFILRIIR
jgi:hypothetical protein